MQTIQSSTSAHIMQVTPMETGINHTSAAWFEESVGEKASAAAVLQAACRRSAPIRRTLHCVLYFDSLQLIGLRDVHRRVTAVRASSLPQHLMTQCRTFLLDKGSPVPYAEHAACQQ